MMEIRKTLFYHARLIATGLWIGILPRYLAQMTVTIPEPLPISGKYIQRPATVRFTCQRHNDSSNIVYYLSRPRLQDNENGLLSVKKYPILILCGGSSNREKLESVIFSHQYFWDKIDALYCGLVTVEDRGVDHYSINEQEFWDHYSRSQRLADHLMVTKYLISNPPPDWDGTFIFLGISEGEPIVNRMTTSCNSTRAAITWVGQGAWNWADILWSYLESFRKENTTSAYLCNRLPTWLYNKLPSCQKLSGPFPETREAFDTLVEQIKQDPSLDKQFGGMSYLYHADAFAEQPIDYTKIYAPMLVVAGAKDTHCSVASSDEFVNKAKQAGAPITYLRVADMDHWIRRRPDVIDASFEWLKQHMSVDKKI